MGHTYPGPGSTIAPAVVFGYLAALHAAAQTATSTAASPAASASATTTSGSTAPAEPVIQKEKEPLV